ncbi:hypothetical protein [Glycomyces sp. NRRL B-16210]|uniref:hypothetical protein n=1 Tax=Glycomyces sp. NRRL B-16210 TaxID=1463821 RepID=UPI0004BFB334|nr:hypothetical protein [Glycomyces sp. NRRL B-16210]
MSQVYADPARIRGAGDAVREQATQLRPVAADTDTGATEARSQNTGFRTGMACKTFAEQFGSLADRLEKRVLDEGKHMKDSADAWEDCDQEIARSFDDIGRELD